MNKPIFALLTDFGNDFAVASIRGVILQQLPEATIVDVDHTIEKFSLVSASFVINKVYRYFPKGTHFICVIDPGVGTNRKALYIQADGYHFIGPDNGIFHEIIKGATEVKAFQVNEEVFNISSVTFHGRDLFTPAAIAIAQKREGFLLPTPVENLIPLEKIENEQLISYIDSFGNIKTNVTLPSNNPWCAQISIQEKSCHIPLARTFGEVNHGQVLGYKGSNNTLEIAVHLGNAGKHFKARAGDALSIDFNPCKDKTTCSTQS